jgi:hypothetical protein
VRAGEEVECFVFINAVFGLEGKRRNEVEEVRLKKRLFLN